MERENRYLVLKRKDIDKYLTDEAKEELDNILMALSIAKQPDIDTGADGEIDCVVVEKDWPEYEKVWEMIESRVDKMNKIKWRSGDLGYIKGSDRCVGAFVGVNPEKQTSLIFIKDNDCKGYHCWQVQQLCKGCHEMENRPYSK